MRSEHSGRRSVLKTSGTALAAIGGVAVGGTASTVARPIEDDGGPEPSVTTGSTYVYYNNVTLYGSIHSTGDDSSVDAWFEFGPEGTGLQDVTRELFDLGEGGYCDGYGSDCAGGCNYNSFRFWDIDGTFEYRAYAENTYGHDRGAIRTFTVNSPTA